MRHFSADCFYIIREFLKPEKASTMCHFCNILKAEYNVLLYKRGLSDMHLFSVDVQPCLKFNNWHII